MSDISPYANRLSPWFGLGGHPEVTSENVQFTHGKEHDYRTRRLGDEDFVAEQRPVSGAWKELSRGHKTAYIAGIACAAAEGRAQGVQAPAPPQPEFHLPVTGRLPTTEPNTANPPRKLSAVERLKAGKQG